MKFRIGFYDGRAITVLLTVFDSFESAEQMIKTYQRSDSKAGYNLNYVIVNCYENGSV